MHNKLNLILIITLMAGGLGGAPASEPARATNVSAYVEPGLNLPGSSTLPGRSLAVIVTAEDVEGAARAVANAGGQVSSELWLIDAVGATVPGAQLKTLAATPGIVSVVRNKDVRTSQA